jgi:hypothetical protein
MNSVLQVSLILGFVTVGFLVTGIVLWYRTRSFIDRSQKAIGVVIKVRKISFENRDTFAPVVRFSTSDGRNLSFTDRIARYPAEFEVGERTQVLYDLRNPHNARVVKRIPDLFLLSKLFGVAGGALLALGFVIGTLFALMN